MNEKIITVIAILMSYALLQGCAGQSRVESGFGDAVREVTRNQIYDANAADYPDPDAVEGGDSYRLENVVEEHLDATGPLGRIVEELKRPAATADVHGAA